MSRSIISPFQLCTTYSQQKELLINYVKRARDSGLTACVNKIVQAVEEGLSHLTPEDQRVVQTEVSLLQRYCTSFSIGVAQFLEVIRKTEDYATFLVCLAFR